MNESKVVSICFSGGTPFAFAMLALFDGIDDVGAWTVAARMYVHPDEASLVRELLEGDGIPFNERKEYVQEASFRA